MRAEASDDPVAVLVRRALADDAWGSAALYRRFVHDATRVAIFVLGRTADAEDVVHDAFYRAFERLDQLQDPSAFGPWIKQITVNEARKHARRRARLRLWWSTPQMEIDFEQLAAPGATGEQRAELTLLGEALRELDVDARAAWVMRRVEGWPLQDVADALDVSLATVKRRIEKADLRIARHTGTA